MQQNQEQGVSPLSFLVAAVAGGKPTDWHICQECNRMSDSAQTASLEPRHGNDVFSMTELKNASLGVSARVEYDSMDHVFVDASNGAHFSGPLEDEIHVSAMDGDLRAARQAYLAELATTLLGLPETRAGNTATLERIDGGRNRVVVVRTEQSESTFVVPSGYSEVETLQSEAHAAEQKAAALMTQVQGLQARAELARIGVKLIREEATLRADSVTPQAEKPRRGSLKR